MFAMPSQLESRDQLKNIDPKPRSTNRIRKLARSFREILRFNIVQLDWFQRLQIKSEDLKKLREVLSCGLGVERLLMQMVFLSAVQGGDHVSDG
jgi:hypothetical protein